jgi:hypothetical protein
MNFLSKIEEFFRNRSKTPWAKFETNGVGEDGLVKFQMTWNNAFLENVAAVGFTGHNAQEVVENFLLGSIMIPKDENFHEALGENSAKNSLQPTSQSNIIKM